MRKRQAVTFGHPRPLRGHPAEDADERGQCRVAALFRGHAVAAEDAQLVLTSDFHWFNIKLPSVDCQGRCRTGTVSMWRRAGLTQGPQQVFEPASDRHDDLAELLVREACGCPGRVARLRDGGPRLRRAPEREAPLELDAALLQVAAQSGSAEADPEQVRFFTARPDPRRENLLRWAFPIPSCPLLQPRRRTPVDAWGSPRNPRWA
jgi:hypothetical protein